MIELILAEVAVGISVVGVKHVSKTAKSRLGEKAPLKIMDAHMVQYLPRREALFKPIADCG